PGGRGRGLLQLVLGDTCDTPLADWKPCKGTLAFFLGQLTGGTTSFVPVVEWVVGTMTSRAPR
ncbi:MAG TPA: hypothetical protein VLQ93_07860, partial [Myxococcaceae bacterium]|nr:hypothetical protein [Myxococcaceae bacterium]